MPASDIEARVHATLTNSRSNGPGRRNVVWFQGCSRRCPGCFNPETHPHDGGEMLSVVHAADLLLTGSPEGVSVSGGEPLEQPGALLALLDELRGRAPELSLLMYTGYTMREVRAMLRGPAILGHLDILVAGPYIQSLKMPLLKARSLKARSLKAPSPQGRSPSASSPQGRSRSLGESLLGSSNQKVHLLSARHKPGELNGLPSSEVILRRDGTVVLTGSAPLRLKRPRNGGHRVIH